MRAAFAFVESLRRKWEYGARFGTAVREQFLSDKVLLIPVGSSPFRSTMELETATPGPPSKLNFVFYNDRGLRAGWRLLIFAVLLYTTFGLLGFLARLLRATAAG